jgi:ubiquinone/menaquinone biosynthesis C-methylase UbiE
MRVLHFAPEAQLRTFFMAHCCHYETADLTMSGVDYHVDLLDLPFEDGQYDLVFASHVLEHIAADRVAIGELSRILAPGGIAILPVPIVVAATVEYTAPNQEESYHVRAPGLDYFERYRTVFSKVELFSSKTMAARYQLYIYEDRSDRRSGCCPQRPEKHSDYVPVCHKEPRATLMRNG